MRLRDVWDFIEIMKKLHLRDVWDFVEIMKKQKQWNNLRKNAKNAKKKKKIQKNTNKCNFSPDKIEKIKREILFVNWKVKARGPDQSGFEKMKISEKMKKKIQKNSKKYNFLVAVQNEIKNISKD